MKSFIETILKIFYLCEFYYTENKKETSQINELLKFLQNYSMYIPMLSPIKIIKYNVINLK